MVRRNWPERLGKPPKHMISGVPDTTDGRMLAIAEQAGGRIINPDRMWHYTEGINNWNPIWTHHGIRILPGPSSLWLDATGKRLPGPLLPGFDTLGTIDHITKTGTSTPGSCSPRRSSSASSRSAGPSRTPTSPARTSAWCCARGCCRCHGAGRGVQEARRGLRGGARPAVARGRHEPHHERSPALDFGTWSARSWRATARSTTPTRRTSRSPRSTARRHYLWDRLTRVAPPHKLLDPAAGPLIAVRL